jgi:peptide/nickel transport system permease protein
MRRLIIGRFLIAVPTLIVSTALTFTLVSLIPGDPAATVLGENATRAQYAAVDRQLGVNKPLIAQYLQWVGRALRGNLGHSLFTNQSVASMLNSRLPVTLSLALGTMVLTAILGVGLGVLSARESRIVARTSDVVSLVGLSLPSFWVGLMLINLVAVGTGILPATGYVNFTTSIGGWARSLLLPVLTLTIAMVAIVAKQTRDALLDALSSDYIRVLRANGVTERSLLYRHALRNAAIPVTTVLGLIVVGLLGGTVVVEQVFALPGLGSLAVLATNEHDLPVIEGVVTYFVLIVVAVTLVLDLAYGWLNPKVRK